MKGFKIELEANILHFWMEKMIDVQHGGFYGAIDGNNNILSQANKGAVMHLRILWTFSAAYRVLGHGAYREMADRAFDYIRQYFVDPVYGGVFWELDYLGTPVQAKKQTYAQGFALYAFTEYHRATHQQEALDLSIAFFEIIERCRDHKKGGYWEAFTQDWLPIEDMRLSDKDENEAKTMNTHLHILEPYTNLLRVWPEERLVTAQRTLIHIFLDRIYDSRSGHLHLFFDEDWQVKGDTVSYGHDIEATWLLLEAARVLGDTDLQQNVETIALDIAKASKEGLLDDGSMAYELKSGHLDKERHWWVQAEAVVGYRYAARLSHDKVYEVLANKLWQYIQNQLVDNQHGEWYWSRMEDGTVNTKDDKAGFWKCPYHNGRMCLEMIEHFSMV